MHHSVDIIVRIVQIVLRFRFCGSRLLGQVCLAIPCNGLSLSRSLGSRQRLDFNPCTTLLAPTGLFRRKQQGVMGAHNGD